MALMINDRPWGPLHAAQTPDRPVRRYLDYGHSKRPDVSCTHLISHRLTCAEYDAMRDRAGGRCEICRRRDRDTPRGELVIDHFTGRGTWFVRGLLCDRCNALMQRHDGTAPWGPATSPYAAKARAYHLVAFAEPSYEDLEHADEVIQQRRVALEDRFPGRALQVPSFRTT